MQLQRIAVVLALAVLLGCAALAASAVAYDSGGASAPTGNQMVPPRPRLPRILRLVARCESRGNPRAVSSSGRYRGKYQFTYRTWRSLGGNGDPAKAPLRLQDRLALRLYRKRGLRPWPRCAVIARRAMSRS